MADLGSGLQSAHQRQLAIMKRLDAVSSDCSSVNNSVLSADDELTALNARLNNLQAVLNHTLVRYCCTEAFLHEKLLLSTCRHLAHASLLYRKVASMTDLCD